MAPLWMSDEGSGGGPDGGGNSSNFLSSLMSSLAAQSTARNASGGSTGSLVSSLEAETEEGKLRRLKLARIAEIEAGELRRARRVAEDRYAYLLLFSLQFLPLLGADRMESIVYFFGVAVTTVYLGGRQEVVDAPERISRSNALYAPIGASLAIGGLYLLLKAGIDITAI